VAIKSERQRSFAAVFHSPLDRNVDVDRRRAAPHLAACLRPSAAISGEHAETATADCKLNEYGLYGFLLVQPLTGLANTLLHGRPFALFVWQVPAWFAPYKAISHLFQTLHELGSWMLLALIGIHAAAALFHGLILRDGVLQRMLPWTIR
jgi:cytochrome b561